MERTRTLSNKANTFDRQRLQGTKPEIKYRLKFVKKADSETKETENGASETKQKKCKWYVSLLHACQLQMFVVVYSRPG